MNSLSDYDGSKLLCFGCLPQRLESTFGKRQTPTSLTTVERTDVSPVVRDEEQVLRSHRRHDKHALKSLSYNHYY